MFFSFSFFSFRKWSLSPKVTFSTKEIKKFKLFSLATFLFLVDVCLLSQRQSSQTDLFRDLSFWKKFIYDPIMNDWLRIDDQLLGLICFFLQVTSMTKLILLVALCFLQAVCWQRTKCGPGLYSSNFSSLAHVLSFSLFIFRKVIK